jgi:hypothetical protein
MEDHLSRLEWARTYLETSEFKYLPDELKELIRKHVKDRMDLAAQEAAPQGQDPLLALPDASITAAGLPGVEGAINPSVGDPLEEAGII